MRFFTDRSSRFRPNYLSLPVDNRQRALQRLDRSRAGISTAYWVCVYFIPEQAVLSFMITLSPNFKRISDALVDAGLVQNPFAWPGVGEQFTAAGVPTYAFKGQAILDSSLSRMHGRT